ncbi:hypothetical protein [Rhodopseudomonas palustris]|uniref:hypothetical protein n=1 Tax=Rhodopseudomonas palustris TaxID=1076 RepID=UPI000AC3D891|nr:hypothetical protein [Rhodopseudomonas palustris]
MVRLYLICAALCLATAAQAKGNAQFWPRYVETESIVTIAPYGVWIDDRAMRR